MPLNPLTGEVDYGGASYDPQNMNAGMAMRAAAKADADVPFFFDLAESLPGVTTAALFNARRYANTLEKGGRFDVAAGAQGRKLRRAQRTSAMIGRNAAPTTAQQFVGGKGIFRKYAQSKVNKGKNALVGPSAANNISPRSLNRFHSLRALTGDSAKGYTPFQSTSGIVNGIVGKSARAQARLGMTGFDSTKDKAFSGGVLGRISSLNKLNTIENIIAKGPGSSKFSLARYNKASASRASTIANIAKVQNLANPGASVLANTQATKLQAQFARSNVRAMARLAPAGMVTDDALRLSVRAAGSSTTATLNAAAATRRAALFANPSKVVAESMTTGILSNRLTKGYLGIMNAAEMTLGQTNVANNVVRGLAGFGDDGATAMARYTRSMSVGGKYSGGFSKQVAGGVKQINMARQYAVAGGSRVVGAKFAAMGVARIGGAAMAPLNVLATGQLMYDLAKGAGKIAVKGVNFAKDALKSMQGTINKPMFGAGFKDNEVAATSRSRGVMAIQNSRLNARSLLGAEGSMLAAHYG